MSELTSICALVSRQFADRQVSSSYTHVLSKFMYLMHFLYLDATERRRCPGTSYGRPHCRLCSISNAQKTTRQSFPVGGSQGESILSRWGTCSCVLFIPSTLLTAALTESRRVSGLHLPYLHILLTPYFQCDDCSGVSEGDAMTFGLTYPLYDHVGRSSPDILQPVHLH